MIAWKVIERIFEWALIRAFHRVRDWARDNPLLARLWVHVCYDPSRVLPLNGMMIPQMIPFSRVAPLAEGERRALLKELAEWVPSLTLREALEQFGPQSPLRWTAETYKADGDRRFRDIPVEVWERMLRRLREPPPGEDRRSRLKRAIGVKQPPPMTLRELMDEERRRYGGGGDGHEPAA